MKLEMKGGLINKVVYLASGCVSMPYIINF